MVCDETRPEDLAAQLGIPGKTLRAWLRREFPRSPGEHGTNWYLSHADVSAAKTKYGQRGTARTYSRTQPQAPRVERPRDGGGRGALAAAKGKSKSVEEIIRALRGQPASAYQARLPHERGGLPPQPGLYAWWATEGAIGGLPAKAHARAELGLVLLYVGIAPNRPESSATIRSRVMNNHLSGNTGSSTFRFTLAALLLDDLGFHPVQTTTKFVLPPKENRVLTTWQEEHLRLTWCVTSHPWLREDEVIAVMEPPLNLAANAKHPYYSTLKQARAAFRRASKPSKRES